MADIFTILGRKMKILITLLLVLFSFEATAGELKASKYEFVKQSIGKGKPYFLEVGSDSCRSCKIMSDMLYKVSVKNPSYNIHFVNVKKEREAAFEMEIRMIPTQIIYDKDGKEVYRHIGVLSSDELNNLFKEYSF